MSYDWNLYFLCSFSWFSFFQIVILDLHPLSAIQDCDLTCLRWSFIFNRFRWVSSFSMAISRTYGFPILRDRQENHLVFCLLHWSVCCSIWLICCLDPQNFRGVIRKQIIISLSCSCELMLQFSCSFYLYIESVARSREPNWHVRCSFLLGELLRL